MNKLLMAKRPPGVDEAKWKRDWEAAVYVLRPLAEVLRERKEHLQRVKPEDFALPNHYGKLVFDGGRVTELDFLLSLLPQET